MNRDTLISLRERVRAGCGPDMALDLDIVKAVGVRDVLATGRASFTSSMDAAVALMERLLPGCAWTIEKDACWVRVLTGSDVAVHQSGRAAQGGKWTVRAILDALLAALIEQEQR